MACVELELSNSSTLIIDAGAGIRSLGVGGRALLAHLHLDHIQGLMFFAPCFRSETKITNNLGPVVAREPLLEERIARYISGALSPSRSASFPAR